MKESLLLSLFVVQFFWVTAQQKSRPNIILILSDDAGYADFGFQSNRFIATPNIDRIANEGAKFTDAYVTGAVCAPSRAGILTGINQAEFGNVNNYIGGVTYNIPKEEYGIPTNIKLVGDYMHGLGYKTGMIGKWHEGFSKPYHPNQRGFDYFWGFLWGDSPYFTGRAKEIEENGLPVAADKIEYLTDAIGNRAVGFISQEKDHPFFLYVAFNAVHAPMHAKEEHVSMFKGKVADSIRRVRAAMTWSMDENIGKILRVLDSLKILDNTLIIFTNDNGGALGTSELGDNYPLRGGKAQPFEGGLRVPMAIRWPGKIKSGTVSKTIVSTLDLMPTFINAAGGNAGSYKTLQGIDLVRMLKDKQAHDKYQNRALYWQITGNAAMRQGDWKLVYKKGEPVALYNLKKDIGETNNQYDSEKTVAEQMETLFKKWKKSLPAPWYYSVGKPKAN